MKINKRLDKQLLGGVLGILVPILSFTVFYYVKESTLSIFKYFSVLVDQNILSSLMSVCVYPNLLLFFIFIWLKGLKAARGVLLATFFLAVLVFIAKFAF